MYNSSIKWYNKHQVLNIFPITERTYFRKLKNLDENTRTKVVKNPKGKSSTLIYYKDLERIFGQYRKPSELSNLTTKRKYVGTSRWDVIGNVVPHKASIDFIVKSMEFIKSMLAEKKSVGNNWFFYSIEKNPNDEYYHSHFLIKTEMTISQVENIFELICETDLGTNNRMWIRKYDFDTYSYSGSFYSFKTRQSDKGEISVYNQLY
jgi:hypothetical protein